MKPLDIGPTDRPSESSLRDTLAESGLPAESLTYSPNDTGAVNMNDLKEEAREPFPAELGRVGSLDE